MYRRMLVFLFLFIAVLAVGCQTAEPQEVTVTEFVEVTRLVEVTVEPEVVTEFVEVTRMVEVPVEVEAEEALSIMPSLRVDVRQYSSLNGREYIVYVVLPMSYDAAEMEYPVMYVTDGDFYSISTAMTNAQLAFGQEIPELIVVGVGYGGSPMNSLVRRDEDLSPEGAESFMQFLEEELIPDIEASYRTVPSPRIMAGHSAGGFFSMYTLFHAADTFDHILASSPSCAEFCGEYEKSFAESNDALSVNLYVSIGELDAELKAELDAFWAVLEAAGYEGFNGAYQVLDGETHLSARPRAFTTGIRWLFAGGE